MYDYNNKGNEKGYSQRNRSHTESKLALFPVTLPPCVPTSSRDTAHLDSHSLPVTSIASLSVVSLGQRINTDAPPLRTHTTPGTLTLIHVLIFVLLLSLPQLHTSSAAVALAVPQDCYPFRLSTSNILKAKSPALSQEQSTPPAPASPRLTARSITEQSAFQRSSPR